MGCSSEKELPKPCVTMDTAEIGSLCNRFSTKNMTDKGRKDVLFKFGFNNKDASAIQNLIGSNFSACPNIVFRQCELIELRNGVGY
jgi:hypothetical protein